MSLAAWEELETWRRILGRQVEACRVEPLAGGNSPSQLARVWLTGASPVDRVVVKDSRGPWSAHDPDGHRREVFAYQAILAITRGVTPGLLHADIDGDSVRLVLEDLTPRFHVRPPDHHWTTREVEAIAQLFARLHGGTQDHPSLSDPRLMPAPDRRFCGDRIRDAAVLLDGLDRARTRPHYSALTEATLERFPAESRSAGPLSLLHSDFGPANVALRPRAVDARFLDWHIAAGGGAGFDLANFFFQPHGNHRHVDISHFLDACDRARAGHGLGLWHGGERTEAFAYCVSWCALSYLPAIARQASGAGLVGWWRCTADAVRDNLARISGARS